MKQAVKYGRVSSDRQEKEGFSLPAQNKLLDTYAIKNNINIVGSFFEAETAKRAGRKQFNEMLKYLKKNKTVRTILVEKTDRLYRNLKDYVLLDEIDDLEIHFVKEGTVLSQNSRSQDKFMHGIRVLMAKNYIDNLSEEIKKGLKEKAEQGYYPMKAPIGYKNIKLKNDKRVIILDAENAPYIKRAFELYAQGVLSYTGIAEKLTSEGFRPNGKICTKRNIELILHNPFYMGSFRFNGKKYEKGKHEPIVTPALFYLVQKRLAEHIPRPQVNNFTYLGLLKCSHCGCAITAEIHKGKYVYYHCTGRKGGTCKKKYIREEKITEAIEQFLKNLILTEDEINSAVIAAKDMLKQKSAFTEHTSAQLEQQIKKLRNRLDALYTDKADGIIEQDFYESKKVLWQSELDKTLLEYEIVNKHDRTFIDTLENVLELCKSAYSLYLQKNNEEKIGLLKILCSNFLFNGESIVIEPFEPFDIIYKRNLTQKVVFTCRSLNFIQDFVKCFESTNNLLTFENINAYMKKIA